MMNRNELKFRNYNPKDESLRKYCTEEIPVDYTTQIQSRFEELLSIEDEEVPI